MSKSSLSTLNRWLGLKNKDKTMTSGKLSKSSANLSISSTNINETSQLEYNRITPLPAATTNAPFEQTFRITVLLPKDQLYVTRLGARVPLSKLLELVCDNKLLDPEKYEFRNPVDPSQVYNCDLTIGAVGLSEIRLCHKSESYDNFNTDEIMKLHRTSLIRESLSSSEFSSRNSKHTTKTTSPYSSSNSLNSMDSSATSYSRQPKLPTSAQPKVAAPPRKKRAAPRPPSQIAIPEKAPLIIENGQDQEVLKPPQESPLTTKDFSVSTPNLTSSTMLHSDINGNDHLEDYNEVSSGNGSLNSNGYNEDTVLYAQVQKKNALNLNSQNSQDVGDSLDTCAKFPEPSPRKKIVQVKKKTVAPPAPPPRNSLYQDDAVSIASTNVSSISTPATPVGLMNSLDNCVDHGDTEPKFLERNESKPVEDVPKPLPRVTTSNSTSTTLLNITDIEQDLKAFESESDTASKNKSNVSKVLLNRTPTPEPRSLSCEPPELDTCYETQLEHFEKQRPEDDCVSKQADSGIGEPVPSPIPDSLPSEASALDVKSNFESSSDDDDMVKVYNFKLGKTLVKPLNETKTLEELTVMNNEQEETDSEMGTSLTLTQVPTPNTVSETSSWNFSISISPPPNFADNKFMENLETDTKPDTPITPKIMERPILNFEDFKREQEPQDLKDKEAKPRIEDKPLKSPTTPLDNILGELSTIIQEKGLDTLIKKSDDPQQIEAAKPNTLSNFTINSISQSNTTKPKEVFNDNDNKNNTHSQNESLPKETINHQSTSVTKPPEVENNTESKTSSPLSSPSSTPDEEKMYRKRSSITSLKQRRSISRSDSFHSTAANTESVGLNKRTSSQLSLDQMSGQLNRRRSSSELSIGESPSLQSLEVIKTILNSRKNSLANSSGEEDKPIEVQARRPSEELKFTSLELKSSKAKEPAHQKEEDQPQMPNEQTSPNKINQATPSTPAEDKPKELPKVYRYSGPPSINFSTWNERPKVHVAIKNEGDYIFGVGKSNMENKIYHRMSTPVVSSEPPPVAPKPATIQRMGIPEKEYKVPILVKPLQDVVIDTVNQKEKPKKPDTLPLKTHTNNMELKTSQPTPTHTPTPSVEALLRPKPQFVVNTSTTTNTLQRQSQRPTVEAVLRPQTQIIVNTSTLPRAANKQRFSTAASPAPGPQLLRSTSIKQQQEPVKPSTAPVENQQAPFGQNTLRRTGLKEKILAKEEQDKQKAMNVQTVTTPSTAPANQTTALANGDVKPKPTSQNSITSAKLHLNLKKTSTSVTSITLNQGPKTSSPSLSSSVYQPPVAPKTAPILTTSLKTFCNGTTPPPPPAPPAMLSTVQLKPVTAVRPAAAATTTTDDSRNELLSAIRNFNKEALKKT